MGKQLALVLVLIFVSVLVINVAAAQEDVSEDVKRSKEVTEGTTKSWTGWVVDKIWKGFGSKNDDVFGEDTTRLNNNDRITDVVTGQSFPSKSVQAEDGAHGTKDRTYETASEAYDKATETAQQAKQTASETAKEATDKASSLKDAATEKASEVMDKAKQFTKQASENTITIKEKAKQKATDTAEDVRDTVAGKTKEAKDEAILKAEEGTEEGESTSWVKAKAKEGYDGVKKRAGKTVHNAKEMAKDMVSPQYEDDEL